MAEVLLCQMDVSFDAAPALHCVDVVTAMSAALILMHGNTVDWLLEELPQESYPWGLLLGGVFSALMTSN